LYANRLCLVTNVANYLIANDEREKYVQKPDYQVSTTVLLIQFISTLTPRTSPRQFSLEEWKAKGNNGMMKKFMHKF